MKKVLYIAIPLILIIFLSVFFLSQRKGAVKQSSENGPPSEPATLPPSTPENRPQSADPITKLEVTSDDKLLQDTPSGPVQIKNFAKLAEKGDNGIIYPVDKKNYNIGYNPTSQEFIVTLLATNNIEDVRQDAENDLLEALGISRTDACKLNVYLYISAALTENTALSQNHGLSFCPGSQSF